MTSDGRAAFHVGQLPISRMVYNLIPSPWVLSNCIFVHLHLQTLMWLSLGFSHVDILLPSAVETLLSCSCDLAGGCCSLSLHFLPDLAMAF